MAFGNFASSRAIQHFLYFFPLPQEHGSLRPGAFFGILSLPEQEGESPMARLEASLWRAVLRSLEMPEPSRCPYCPDRPEPHWIDWGCYLRWAQGRREKIHVPRHQCQFVKRTFSVLPDGLLPYHYHRTAVMLRTLQALFVDETPLARWAKLRHLCRTTVRHLREKFEETVGRLRLPGQEGALGPKVFLARLFRLGADRIAEIFRDWKELEPKHSVVGLYAR
jgi:hypothetical protein